MQSWQIVVQFASSGAKEEEEEKEEGPSEHVYENKAMNDLQLAWVRV